LSTFISSLLTRLMTGSTHLKSYLMLNGGYPNKPENFIAKLKTKPILRRSRFQTNFNFK